MERRGERERPPERERVRMTRERAEWIAEDALETEAFFEMLQSKVQSKVDFKRLTSEDDGTNDVTEWKRLGAFIIHEHTFPQELISVLRRNSIDIHGDEPVLELHIPPQGRTLSPADAIKSMQRLAEYLTARQGMKNPLCIYGVSYLVKPLAGFLQRYGFTTFDLPSALKTTSGAARVLKGFSDSSNPRIKETASRFAIDDIQLCVVATEDFLENVRRLQTRENISET